MKKYEQTIKEYAHILGQHPELDEALRQERAELIRKREQMIRLQEMAAHEMKNVLTKICGAVSILERRNLSQEQIQKLIPFLKNGTNQLIDMNTLMDLHGSSRQELRENAQRIDLEKISRNHILIHDQDMHEAHVGINFKYDRPNGSPIEVYAHLGATSAIIGTLLENCAQYATKDSNINHGSRVHKGNLELMFENSTTGLQLRTGYGLGKGRGFPFAREIIETLGGRLTKYHTPQMARDYHHFERYGFLDGKNPSPKTEIFGVKVTIPMSELQEPKPN